MGVLRMGVVADDVTGANDIGSMFVQAGCAATVYTAGGVEGFRLSAKEWGLPEVAIINTNSRLDAPEEAARKVRQATQALRQAGYPRFFKKTCSVFRGNIGAEFDAMLDTLEARRAVVVLGFPKNGRTTVNAIHYVNGTRLEDSQFRYDPIHPMTRSNLVEILQGQTHHKVGWVGSQTVQAGEGALRQAVEAQTAGGARYVILDVADPAALETIAAALKDEPMLCGSSALGETLPPVWGVTEPVEQAVKLPYPDEMGLLCVAGSLMPQTRAQVAHVVAQGAECFEINVPQILHFEDRMTEIDRLQQAASAALRRGRNVVLQAPHDPDQVAVGRAEGRSWGLDSRATGRAVSDALGQTTARVVRACELNRLVVAGGETSDAVCTHLGVQALRIWKEIEPGLPSCLTLEARPRWLILKSGSFGTREFIERAFHYLRSC